VTDLYPERLPDLFVGRPIVLAGRFSGNGNGAVRVRGKVAGEMQELALNLPTDDLAARHPGIPCVWARTRIADLADRMTHEGNANLPTEIKQVALEYGLMSAYTAFLAVDSLTRTAGDGGVTVAVPVPVPDGVRYETTVQE
jgi:Ca-activated chloride channel family protein